MINTIKVKTEERTTFHDVTAEIQTILDDSIKEGILIVYSAHTTCALTVNEGFDKNVAVDVNNALDAMVPPIHFSHEEGNSDSHLKTTLLSNSITLPIKDGNILLGQWQRIFLFDFDGPRERQVYVQQIKVE